MPHPVAHVLPEPSVHGDAEALFALEVERLRQQPLREALRQYLAVGGGRAQGIRHGAERTLDYATNQPRRSEEHTSELQSLIRISHAVFYMNQNKKDTSTTTKSSESYPKLYDAHSTSDDIPLHQSNSL